MHVRGLSGQRFVKMRPRQEMANALNGMRLPRVQKAHTRNWYDVQLQLLDFEEKPAQGHDGPIDYEYPRTSA